MSSPKPLTLPQQPERLQQLGPHVWTARWPGQLEATLIAKEARQDDAQALEREWQALRQVPTDRLPRPLRLDRDTQGRAHTLWLHLRAGTTLEQHALQNPLRTAREALQALKALHSTGLVHGDLHPGNLLVDTHGQLTLLDLGLASPLGQLAPGAGHPQFAAPQRLLGLPVDPRDDLFSLAMSLWHALNWSPPWPDYPAVLPHPEQQPKIQQVSAQFQPLQLFLLKCLSPQREHRPLDAERAERALLDLAERDPEREKQELIEDLRALLDRPLQLQATLPPLTGTLRLPDDLPGLTLDLPADALHVHPRDLPQLPALPTVFAGLGDRKGALARQWQKAWLELRARLPAEMLLVVHETAQLDPSAQLGLDLALEDDHLAPVVVLERENPRTWQPPPLEIHHLGVLLRQASGGRTWDLALVRAIAQAAGHRHARVWQLAATLLQSEAVALGHDRVELVPGMALPQLAPAEVPPAVNVENLLQAARQNPLNAPELVLQALHHGAELSQVPPELRLRPELRLAIAHFHFQRGEYQACRLEAQSVQSDPSPAIRAEAHLWQAFAATWQGDREAARTAAEAGEAENQPQFSGYFAYLRALSAYYAGQLNQSDEGFAQILADFATDSVLQAAAAGGRGLVAQRAGNLTDARKWYENSRQVAEENGDRLRALNMGMNVATLDHEQGDLGRALAGYNRVVTAARRLGNSGALTRALGNRGNLLSQLGDDARARLDLDEALAGYRQQENPYLAGNTACVLAEIARRAGQWPEAAVHLAAAEQQLGLSNSPLELLEVQLEKGELLRISAQPEQAAQIARDVRTQAELHAATELQARATWLQTRLLLDKHQVTPEVLERLASQLLEATKQIPPGKPLLRVAMEADRALALALHGQLVPARELAQDMLRLLETIATSLPRENALQFQASANWQPARSLFRVLARLPERTSPQPMAGLPALGSILSINRRMGAERELQPLLEIVMDSAVLLTGAERGFLLLFHDDELRVMVARNLDRENLKKAAHKLSWGIAGQVFADGERILTTDALQDDRFRTQASVHHGSLRSILCVPMAWQGQPIGALYVDNRFTAGAFSSEHAGVLEALADQAAIAVEHARVVEAQKKAQQNLEESRRQVQALAEQLQNRLDQTEHALDDARAELVAQRLDVQRRSDYGQIRGESPLLQRLFALMDRVRDHDFPVLVVGESGTGKELVARALHFTGRRQKSPFLAINCAALPSNLLESELFGHVRGAFTGAIADRKGLFEAADGGTLFLDEIGEMPLEMQPKLLRVLQTGELQRVGATQTRKVNVRVVAATHRNLPEMAENGQFRPDLLFRLRVVELTVPPLRQRTEDIALLAEYFLSENRKSGIGQVERLTPGALRRLREFSWPGNVRQLETVLKSASLFASRDVLDVPDLEGLLGRERQSETHATGPWWREAPLEDIVRRAVRERVQSLGGNKRKAAESLGIDRTTLYARLKGDEA